MATFRHTLSDADILRIRFFFAIYLLSSTPAPAGSLRNKMWVSLEPIRDGDSRSGFEAMIRSGFATKRVDEKIAGEC